MIALITCYCREKRRGKLASSFPLCSRSRNGSRVCLCCCVYVCVCVPCVCVCRVCVFGAEFDFLSLYLLLFSFVYTENVPTRDTHLPTNLPILFPLHSIIHFTLFLTRSWIPVVSRYWRPSPQPLPVILLPPPERLQQQQK